eukprot:TRINITY_DN28051_c0_g2_i2.p1 TRINITY_DN28051_c0_g2~~TRINITY_DN28051_c0_g2_i2.p1  ORF type:complete len:834 (+),score=76.52 TRINITY_DN28051_c0_g2_i2:157-2658(+)
MESSRQRHHSGASPHPPADVYGSRGRLDRHPRMQGRTNPRASTGRHRERHSHRDHCSHRDGDDREYAEASRRDLYCRHGSSDLQYDTRYDDFQDRFSQDLYHHRDSYSERSAHRDRDKYGDVYGDKYLADHMKDALRAEYASARRPESRSPRLRQQLVLRESKQSRYRREEFGLRREQHDRAQRHHRDDAHKFSDDARLRGREEEEDPRDSFTDGRDSHQSSGRELRPRHSASYHEERATERVKRRRTEGRAEGGARDEAAYYSSRSRQERPRSSSDRRHVDDRRSGGDAESAQRPAFRRIWVSKVDCARIIGKGGETLKDLQDRTNTRMQVQNHDEADPDSMERWIDISGAPDSQEAATNLILTLTTYCCDSEGTVLKDDREFSKDAVYSKAQPTTIFIPTEEVGRVLGRGGEVVKSIEAATTSRLQLEKNTGRLIIMGDPDVQDNALKMVLEEVSYAKSADGSWLKERPKADTADEPEKEPEKERADEAAAAPATLAGADARTTVWVKSREAGKIIGRGGETIKHLKDKTGARVQVKKDSEEYHGILQREVAIFGTEGERNNALEMILDEISWCRDRTRVLKDAQSEPERGQQKDERYLADKDRDPRGRGRVREPRSAGGERQAGPGIRDAEGAASMQEADNSNEKGERGPRKRRAGANQVGWICSTCGGGHRSKDCPNVAGLWGMSIHMGMQMGMQALAMQAMRGGMAPDQMPGMAAAGMPAAGLNPMLANAMAGGMIQPWMSQMPVDSSDSSSSSSSRHGSCRADSPSPVRSEDRRVRAAERRDGSRSRESRNGMTSQLFSDVRPGYTEERGHTGQGGPAAGRGAGAYL